MISLVATGLGAIVVLVGLIGTVAGQWGVDTRESFANPSGRAPGADLI